MQTSAFSLAVQRAYGVQTGLEYRAYPFPFPPCTTACACLRPCVTQLWQGDVHMYTWSNTRTRYMNIFASTWALTAAGIVFALPMVYFRVKDHTEIRDEAL